ncbi:2-hydroxymuconic semialdehyde dehydrogenase [Pigmentiphaga sp.]|uniref:2-hydroxymuconic semialdehyde dehydrogenase n=1 Tax=Pigmentiphaga sp. TaxID=1977564 RepID=UPI0025E7B0CF|nr:2-hydroxymuconic semialdehyde dehydrogenase [Pigmentiphaga sp.]MBX6319821.1 2-hydroxymuconic semialdehyde dehydrogenase [Pigmentiphaga sp.]
MSTKTLRNFIGGRFEDGIRTFDKLNPANGELIARVHEAGRDQVDAAVAAARRALPAWAAMSVKQRTDYLYALADGIERRFDDFLEAEIGDTGKPVGWARQIDIPRGAANFRAFAEIARTLDMESYMTDTPDGRQALNYAYRKPLGVVGVISPWNLPLLLFTWKVAPALAFGNTVVAKPSEVTPSTATLLAEVAMEVGLPEGVFNLVHGFGPNSAGEFITTHEDIDGVTFTGESATGAAIMKAVAPGVKPVSFELGGKNAALVFEDADFDQAVAGVANSVFANCGQVCLCTERVYVQRPIFDRFVQAVKREAEKLVLGRPMDPATTMGPLVSHEHREKVLSYMRLAVEEGATVVTGGGVPQFGDERDNGAYIQPTIWTGLPETARCIKEEVFGPVCHIAPFDTEEEAIALANDTKYGLAAAVWTTNLVRGHRVAQAMQVGLAWVNCWFLRDLRTPFGGSGLSGIGREGGRHSLHFYTEPTNVCVKL